MVYLTLMSTVAMPVCAISKCLYLGALTITVTWNSLTTGSIEAKKEHGLV